MKKLLFLFISLVFTLASFQLSFAATINVPADQETIAAAITAATTGDTISVAAGTYNETSLSITKDNITLQGAGAATTFIDGVGGGNGVLFFGFSSGAGVASGAVSGFTIKNGEGNFGTGIWVNNSTDVTISNNIIYNNNKSGVFINAKTADTTVTVVNNTIIGNAWGVSARTDWGSNNYTADVTVKNNIIYNNAEEGLLIGGGTEVTYTNSYNDVYWNNSDGDQYDTDVEAGTGAISADPLFTDESSDDFTLQATSPCIDEGDPSSTFSSEPEPNGDRINIGVYGNTANAQTSLDTDSDGTEDILDNCPDDANEDQLDTDSDGSGNACDTDDDDDAVLDVNDNCPLVVNADQADTDADETGDACEDDKDGDLVLDASDNCELVVNADQLDTDSDGEGNACDTDDDDDAVLDVNDNCPLVENADQADADADDIGDACDPTDDVVTRSDVVDATETSGSTEESTTDVADSDLGAVNESNNEVSCGFINNNNNSSAIILMLVLVFGMLVIRRRYI